MVGNEKKKLVKKPRQSSFVAGLNKRQDAVDYLTTKAVNQTREISKQAEATAKANIAKKNKTNTALTAKHGSMYDYTKVMQIQKQLKDAGFYKGAINGDWGKGTQVAWEAYSAQQQKPTQTQQDDFPGIQIPMTPVDRLGNITPECATYSNTFMRSLGLDAKGDAYQVGRYYTPVVNGYDEMNLQRGLSNAQIMNLHRQAADNVQQNLDTLALQKNHIYPVNMYYNTSPHMQEFYNKSLNENTGTPGTHTGVLYNNGNQWMVGHNIHTNVHNEPVSEVLGGRSNPHKYGITAVYDAGAVAGQPDEKKGLFGLGFLGL